MDVKAIENLNIDRVLQRGTGKIIEQRQDAFAEKLECYQVAYYHTEMPTISGALTIRAAKAEDVPLLTEIYDVLTEEEMAEIVRRGNLLLGYEGTEMAGFVGEHLEGSIGLLHVMPKFRRKGYAMALQKKLGLTQSENTIIWMWR